MRKNIKILFVQSAMLLAFAISSFACEAKKITIPASGVTLTGKTGGCARYGFTIAEG